MLVAFVVTTEMQFYYIPTGPFLLDMGATEAWLTATKTVAQISEVLVLTFLLHIAIKKIGVRWTMFIGIMAWPLRYILFMIPSLPIIVAALSLHGFGYAFFMVTGNIYTNKKATDDMRASAQALFIFATWGLGNYIGTLFTGYIWDTFKTPSGETIWWQFFLVPAIMCVVMGLIFLAFFRDDPKLTENGWRAVVAITRGGMAPAMIVARELDIRVVDTISVKSYNHQSQSEPRVIKAPDMDHVGDGTGVLVIDDLVDTGETAKALRQMLPDAHFATVYAKPAGRPLVDTFVTEVSQDTWIFFPWDMEPQPSTPIIGLRG